MYALIMYLGEEIQDGKIILRKNDTAILKVTLYDFDGTPWQSGYTADLIVTRSEVDDPLITLTAQPDPSDDNVFYYILDTITSEPGNYEAWVEASGTYYNSATPLTTSPLIDLSSFKVFKIEVLV